MKRGNYIVCERYKNGLVDLRVQGDLQDLGGPKETQDFLDVLGQEELVGHGSVSSTYFFFSYLFVFVRLHFNSKMFSSVIILYV